MLFFNKPHFFALVSVVIFSNSEAGNWIHYLSTEILNGISCNLFEPGSIDDYIQDLRSIVVGQPFVALDLIPALEKHFAIKWNKKPMALRFHGPPGVGKTFVADYLLKSNFFIKQLIIPVNEIYKIGENEFKEVWSHEIERTVFRCKRSVFLIEDVNETTSAVFNDMPPFRRDPYIDYGKTLFIYVSQSDAEDIVATTSELLKNGIPQHSFNLNSFMKYMQEKRSGILNTLWKKFFDNESKSYNKEGNVHEVYIPFLPLNSKAVSQCIHNELMASGKKMSQSIAEDVLSVVGCPSDLEEFCPTGCKLVSSRLSMSLGQHDEL